MPKLENLKKKWEMSSTTLYIVHQKKKVESGVDILVCTVAWESSGLGSFDSMRMRLQYPPHVVSEYAVYFA